MTYTFDYTQSTMCTCMLWSSTDYACCYYSSRLWSACTYHSTHTIHMYHQARQLSFCPFYTLRILLPPQSLRSFVAPTHPLDPGVTFLADLVPVLPPDTVTLTSQPSRK